MLMGLFGTAFNIMGGVTRGATTASMWTGNMILESFPEANGSMHYEKREGYTVEDWDLTSLSVGEAIVKLPSKEPFRFKFDLFIDGKEG